MNVNSSYTYGAYYTQQMLQKRPQSLSSVINKDEDKTLSAEELSDFTAAYSEKTGAELDITSLMSTYDSDGDGALNESEQEAMNGQKALEQLMFANNPRMKERVTGAGAPPIADKIDQDGDKLWSTDELTQFADLFNQATGETLDVESLLGEYDADGDGALNADEQAEMMEKMAPPPPPEDSRPLMFPMESDEEDSTISALTAEDTDYTALRETLKDIFAQIDEALAKKEETSQAVEESTQESQLSNLLFERLASRASNSYEQSFWYADNSASLFQSAI